MTRSPKLVAALVLLAGIGPFGRVAFAADSTTAPANATATVESSPLAASAAPAAAPTSAAPAADIDYSGAAAEFVAATNTSRAAVGAAPLLPNAALTAYAAQHAATMAQSGNLHHSDIAVLVGAWSTVGENVGVGPSVGAIHAALLASPSHYRNLADRGFTSVGIGVYVDGGGRTWTAHVFGV